MFWSFSIYELLRPKEKYIWAQLRILHETEKATFIDNGAKILDPKIADIWNKTKKQYL